MRRIVAGVAMLALAACCIPTASAEWVPVLKVDIIDDANPTVVEPDFIGWAPLTGLNANTQYPDPITTTIEGITITLDSGYYHQDRFRTSADLTGVPFEAMYRDSFWGRALNQNPGTKGLDITLSGLEPKQPYLIALYAFDYADWNGKVSCDWTANGQFAFNASWEGDLPGGDVPTAWDSFRHTAVVTTDENGEILLVSQAGADHAGNSNYWANISGLEIHAIPEPGIIAGLLSLLLACLLGRRRK